MKFGEHLGSHLTPEWRSQYVEYDEMKKYLYKAEDEAPLIEDTNEEVLTRHFVKYDEDFFIFCDKQLKKINTFFAEKLAEALRRFSEIELEVANAGGVRLRVARSANLLNGDSKGSTTVPSKKVFNGGKKKLKEMKMAVGEFYLSLILLQNYQQLNFTGFRKILKKHDKIFRLTSGTGYRQRHVETAPFYRNQEIDDLIKDTEKIAIEDLEGGNRSKAMDRLRVPPLNERKKTDTKTTFLWGFFSGLFIILLAIVCIAGYYKGQDLRWQPAVRMYRGMFLVIFMVGLLGINVHGWGNGGVNHVLIFELDPRHHLSYVDLLMISSFLGVIWCLSCIAYLFSNDFHIPIFSNPLACGVFLLIFFINPTRTFYFRARRWLLRILLRILRAPFCPVRFADFWLADQLNSLVVAFRDFQYFFCFYCYDWYNQNNEMCRDNKNVVRPFVAFLPAWFRFAQCLRRYYDTRKAFPHLVNAGKYTTSMLVTLISTINAVYPDIDALFYLWIISLIIGTLYTLFWDIRMDWGLFAKNAGENRFLREQIIYSSKIYYYLAVIADLIFRFLWTLTVSIGNLGWMHEDFFTFFIAVCEVIRRFIWNFFRLENEHLNNVGEFRAVRDISFKPMVTKQDEKLNMSLEQIMDLEEGPIPKRKAVQYIMNSQNAEVGSRSTVIANAKRKFSTVLKIT